MRPVAGGGLESCVEGFGCNAREGVRVVGEEIAQVEGVGGGFGDCYWSGRVGWLVGLLTQSGGKEGSYSLSGLEDDTSVAVSISTSAIFLFLVSIDSNDEEVWELFNW